jgi:hypothetical protein
MPREIRWLRAGVAFVWLATGLSVLHPAYRAIGEAYLAKIPLPPSLMWATCAFEVLLGLAVLRGLGRALDGWVALLQVGMVTCFTLILGVLEPALLVHPFGVLTKNLPLLAVVGTIYLVEKNTVSLAVARSAERAPFANNSAEWTPRATWLLRCGVALIWITEGVLPKIFFQQRMEIDVVTRSGLVASWIDPSLFLRLMGAAQAASGIAVLLLPGGRLLRLLLVAQVAALVVLPVLVSLPDLTVWVHPFGPLIKNAPIIAGTIVVMVRCSR